LGKTEANSWNSTKPLHYGTKVKLLIDECLHTSLRDIAHAAGHIADHVNYLGLGGLKDWELMSRILENDYTFVTNNRSDFLDLHGREALHLGVIIIVPNVTPALQQELFRAALKHIGTRDLTNTVVEVKYARSHIECSEYALPQ
jgi:predicted nuclease of predicted toxin-antitoxin system